MDGSGPAYQSLAPLQPAAGARRAASPDHYPVKRRVACTECRQGKLRCDRPLDESGPCVRCRRFNLECKAESSYKRYNKKLKINELSEQVERLQSVIAGGTAAQSPYRSTDESPGSGNEGLGVRSAGKDRSGSSLQENSHRRYNHVSDAAFSQYKEFLRNRNLTPPPIQNPQNLGTKSLGDVELKNDQTKELFQIFFDRYHHFLEIIDSSLTPDHCFAISPPLFWAIISVAARHYEHNVTLFRSLKDGLLNLLWSTISVLPHSHYTIQAILLIAMWPFPTNSMSRDNSFLLVSIAKSASMQLGLHRPDIIQEFLRIKTRLDQSQFQDAVKVWAGCFIASQCVSASVGQPSTISADWVVDAACDIGNKYTLPDNLRHHLLICKFMARTNELMAQNDRFSNANNTETEGVVFVNMLERDISDLDRQIGQKITAAHRILVLMATLQLRTYYFFMNSNSEIRKQGLLKGYSTSLALISKCAGADKSWDFSKYAPSGYAQILSMAAMFVMKIVQSSYSQYIDIEEAESAFRSVISMMEKASVEEYDLRHRTSIILAHLWDVHLSFTKEREKEPSLNIKSRLGASILHDTLWMWREEIGSNVSKKIAAEPGSNAQSAAIPETTRENVDTMPGGGQISLDDPLNSYGHIFSALDADWIWDLGFPSILPVDVDSFSPVFTP